MKKERPILFSAPMVRAILEGKNPFSYEFDNNGWGGAYYDVSEITANTKETILLNFILRLLV